MSLRFGREQIDWIAPRGAPVSFLQADDSFLAPPVDSEMHDAMERWIPTLSVAGRRRALVLVPDRTRAFPFHHLLPDLARGLVARGIAPADLRVLVASGTHAPTALDLARDRLGPLPAGVDVRAHDADGDTASVGTTPAGTPVHVAPALLEADLVLALGGTAFHYFAGFGGGPKMLFPGAGARASVAANHARSLGAFPPGGLAAGVAPGRLVGNPVYEDLRDAAALLPRVHHLTVYPDGRARLVAATWNDLADWPAITDRFARPGRVGPRAAFDLVLASAGGAPRDIDVVQAHKALHHAALYARDGAEIVLVAACEEGYGSASFERWLGEPDRASLEAGARTRYDLNAQTAVSLAAIAARTRVTWIAARPLPALERWGVQVAARGDAERVISAAFQRARKGAIAYSRCATEVVPGDGKPLVADAGPA